MVLQQVIRQWVRVIAVTIIAAATPGWLAAQDGRITGTATDKESSSPLSTVQVAIQGTGLGALSGANGVYNIANVPPGTYSLIARRVGYGETRQANVVVTAGGTTTVNLTLTAGVLSLQAVISTGVTDPTAGVLAPITVAHLDRANLPHVAAGNAVQNLQGQIAGVRIARGSGQPGSETTIMLRTPTSITQSGAPMIVVDGVILGTSSTSNIESMDIESMEVIKGASASSLYGSRAAAGVISITTKRGKGGPVGSTSFTARSEFGFSAASTFDYLADHHRFLMDPTNSFYVDATGKEVTRALRVAPAPSVAFLDKPYPGATYDNVKAVAQPGGFRTNNFAMTGNTAASNFALTFNTYSEAGALANNKGYDRYSMRLNLDHRLLPSLNVSASTYAVVDKRDEISGTNPFSAAISAPIDIDFSLKDSSGQYKQQPDPNVNTQNPLWTQATRSNTSKSTRQLLSFSLNWAPLSWFSANGSAGYDRGTGESRTYVPKGTPNTVGTDGFSDGSLSLSNSIRETWNLSTQLTVRHDFGKLNARSTIRGILEQDQNSSGSRSGSNFILYGVPQLSNIASTNINASSSESETWSEGVVLDNALTYDDKYIFSLLGRKDGSSLFGPDNRWHNYYRIAGAWRIGQERWFNIPKIQELKLSVAQGTAGGRPPFSAQYETWSLSNGIPSKGNLGNTQLSPEQTVENEISLNAIVFDRVGVTLTHAWRETTDQLVQAPQSVITGYGTQWINSGAIKGHSDELEIQGAMIQRPGFSWNSTVTADKSYSVISEWNIPCDATLAWRKFCQDVPVYAVFALHLVGKNEGGDLAGSLAKHRAGELSPYIDQFAINDEGYAVWVGTGNTYKDGIAKSLWGTVSPTLGGRTYAWGEPIVEQDETGNNRRQQLGTSNPYNVGWVNDVRLGNFALHAQMQGSIGGTGNNTLTHTLISAFTAVQMDSYGKEEGLKKPMSYYLTAVQGNTDYMLQPVTYYKLREVSASYTFQPAVLNKVGLNRVGVKGLQVGLIARNVFTLSSYEGFDPEAALDLGSRSNGDGGGYPPTRQYTAEFSFTF